MRLYELNIVADVLVFFPAFVAFGIAWLCRNWSRQSNALARTLLGAMFAVSLIFGASLLMVGALVFV